MSRRNRKSNTASHMDQKEAKNIKLSKQKHLKRTNLINSLFTYASTLPQKLTATTLWDNHKQMYDIVQQLLHIEAELKIPLPTRTNTTISEMEKWAKDNGAKLNNCIITQIKDVEYGLQAIDFIEQGSVIISIPKNMMITVDCMKGSPMETLYKEDILLQQLPYVAFAIFLLVERFRTDRPSFWLPYFMALPKSYSTCLYFSLEDLNELKGSPALENSMKMYKNIARQYGYFWSVFQKNSDQASNILRDVFTYEQYRWAVSTVITRQNYIPCPASVMAVNVIIPIWDFCNHSNNKDKNDTEVSTTYQVETESCVCIAPQNVAKGEQIYIFYGERSNADFLVYNGFVYPENYHDTIKVKFGISNSDSYMLRLALLRKLKLPGSGEYLIRANKESPIHPSVLAFVRIFKMNEEQLKEWTEKDNIEDVLMGPVGAMEDFDVQVLQYIQTRLSILQKAYPSTLEEDEKIFVQNNLAPMKKLLISFRISEKKILMSACAYCATKVAELKLEKTQLT